MVLALAKGSERTALRRSDVPPETGRGRDFRFGMGLRVYLRDVTNHRRIHVRESGRIERGGGPR